ncbi:hypothetical protein [Serratia ficaria]|uniref:hypothetical protein n=1 Tax=Serratia ficaria TaxID=61651 RepID=UPI0012ECCE47|nr:hypothetical protein [Serratia ficaria]
MKLHLLLATFLLGATFVVNAKTEYEPPKIEGWTLLAGNDDYAFYGKNGSAEHLKGVHSVIIQQVPTNQRYDKKVYYTRFSVSDNDCKRGMGSVNVYDLSGKNMFKSDYVSGGNSVGASIADVVCQTH